jgi:peptidoglycan/xylan/chitin deacetylase (PgdA/CDA1 family)
MNELATRRTVFAKGAQALAALLGLVALGGAAWRTVAPADRSIAKARGELVAFSAAADPAAAVQGAAAPSTAPAAAAEPDAAGAPEWRRLGAAALADRRGQTIRGFSSHRMIHFTFDDGPNLETTPGLLDALADQGVHATFFVLGRQLGGPRSLERRALLQRMEAEGHTVAVHTYNHDDLSRMPAERIASDLGRVEETLQATLGYVPGLVRPPFGRRSAVSDATLRERGYTTVLWNLPPEENARTSDQILRNFSRMLDRMERHPRGPGGIVLLHDTHSESVEAFSLLADELTRRNCALLGVEGEGVELWDVTDDLGPFLLHGGEPTTLPADVLAARQAAARARATARCAALVAEAAAGGGA